MKKQEIKDLVDKEIKNLKWLDLEHITEEDFDDIIDDLKVSFEEEYNKEDFDEWYDDVASEIIFNHLKSNYTMEKHNYEDITNWRYDNQKQEIVFYNTTNNKIKELGTIKNFTQEMYNRLPQDDMECLTELIKIYKEKSTYNFYNDWQFCLIQNMKPNDKKIFTIDNCKVVVTKDKNDDDTFGWSIQLLDSNSKEIEYWGYDTLEDLESAYKQLTKDIIIYAKGD